MSDDFYALSEQVPEGPKPDVVALELTGSVDKPCEPDRWGDRAIAVAEHPPKVRYTDAQEREIYADSADRVAVYHVNGDRVVEYIEIRSPGNKQSSPEVKKFIDKRNDALDRGIHLLIIDILPPGKHDPQGIHSALWDSRTRLTA